MEISVRVLRSFPHQTCWKIFFLAIRRSISDLQTVVIFVQRCQKKKVENTTFKVHHDVQCDYFFSSKKKFLGLCHIGFILNQTLSFLSTTRAKVATSNVDHSAIRLPLFP